MLAQQRPNNVGLAITTGAFVFVVLATVLVQTVFVSPYIERDRATLSLMAATNMMLAGRAASGDSLRADAAEIATVLRDGGTLTGLQGQAIRLSPTTTVPLINAANTLNSLPKERAAQFTSSYQGLYDAFDKTVQTRAAIALGFQIIAFMVAALLLALIAYQWDKRQKLTQMLWQASLKENKSILESTRDGLFMIKPTMHVGSVQSAAVRHVFGVEHNISGNFFDFLSKLVSAETLSDAQNYISAVMEGRVRPPSEHDEHPLSEVEILVENAMGMVSNRYLRFHFSRNALNPGAGLLVSVCDVTREVRLKSELDDAARSNDERFHLLMGSIVEDSEDIRRFFRDAHESLKEINEALRDDNPSQQSATQKLESIFRTVHRLKGNAGSVGVSLMETSAHQFESRIQELLELSNVDSHQILALTGHLKQMIGELDFLEKISAKLAAKNAPVAHTADGVGTSAESGLASPPRSELERFAHEVAERQNKLVSLEKIGFDDFELTESAQTEIDALCLQLVRNSIVHGIEEPEARRNVGKDARGRIVISLSGCDENNVLMVVEDDGAGFDFSAIRESAIASGLAARDIVNQMSKGELVRFVFVSGFTTQDETSIDAGRGVGLDVVKDSVARLGGKIGIKSSCGLSSQVTIRLPRRMLTMIEQPLPELVLTEKIAGF